MPDASSARQALFKRSKNDDEQPGNQQQWLRVVLGGEDYALLAYFCASSLWRRPCVTEDEISSGCIAVILAAKL